MRGGAIAVLGAVLVWASVLRAGEVYRWTDAQGVLHISDLPPPSGAGVQKQTLPDAPPRASTAERAPAAEGAPAAAGQVQGPARVVITAQSSESLGGSRHGVSGTVENRGGATARDVAVAVHVVSPAQGDECLEEEIAVASALKPGEKAEFSADLDHPCFRGPTRIDLRAQWQ